MIRKMLLLIVFSPIGLWAQAENDFTADRPGATTGTDVLPKGRIQWETGVGVEHSCIESPSTTTWTINTSLLRFGISDYAELRLQADGLYTSSDEDRYGGMANLIIGSKLHLFDGWKAIPEMSLLANVMIPGGRNSNYLPENIGGQLGLLFQNNLSSRLSLGYEADVIWGDEEKPTAFWGVCLGLQVSDKLNLMLEEYNYSNVDTECWLEIGAALMLSKKVQIDLATDLSLQYLKRYFNFSIGLAWQIN